VLFQLKIGRFNRALNGIFRLYITCFKKVKDIKF
jgi:hypothetical protein